MVGVAKATDGALAPAPGKKQKQVILYPSPGMGHLVSMIELGKVFAAPRRGLAVTIVVATLPHDTTAGASDTTGPFLAGVTAANPSITFHRLPQVELARPVESAHHEAVTFEVARLSNPHLRSFLATTAATESAVLIVDFFCSVALEVATELHIPTYFFYTSGAAALAFFLYLPVLHSQTAKSFRELGEELLHVPGIPSFPATHSIKPLMDRDDEAYAAFLRVPADLCRSHGIITNTFRSLEPRALDAIAAGLCTPPGLPTPPVRCIGPLIKSEEVTGGDRSCLAWLDSQPESSVVFLCFGSLGLFSAEQIKEIAVGLESSGQRFLWVVRSPPESEKKDPELDALLPEGFLARTRGTGLVVKSWAPQRDVLLHGAVGGFVTHCGWNSVLEAVVAGVPMVAWPLYAEQRMNRVFLEEELGLAVAVEGYDKELVKAEEVALKVRWLMESDGGRVLRERTLAAMRQAREALRVGGQSEATLTRLVDGWMLA